MGDRNVTAQSVHDASGLSRGFIPFLSPITVVCAARGDRNIAGTGRGDGQEPPGTPPRRRRPGGQRGGPRRVGVRPTRSGVEPEVPERLTGHDGDERARREEGAERDLGAQVGAP
jgi:hypothetical protein